MFLRSSGELHQFHRRPIDLDKGYENAIARAIRLNDDFLAIEGTVKVINLERNMGNALDQTGVWRVFPISLPLNPEWIVLMIRNRHLQMWKINLAIKLRGCRNADMVEFHKMGIRCGPLCVIVSRQMYHPVNDRSRRVAATHVISRAICANTVLSNRAIFDLACDACRRNYSD